MHQKKRRHWPTSSFILTMLLAMGFLCFGGRCHHDDEDYVTHYVDPPDRPSGKSSGHVGEVMEFSTGGSYCSEGDSVKYRFDFGDGWRSYWKYEALASHEYDDDGVFYVSAQARCPWDYSSWSRSFEVEILSRPGTNTSTALWKSPEGTLWATGSSGTVSRYLDTQKIDEEKLTEHPLYAIWGESETNVFCCGSKGNLFRFDGEGWKRIPLDVQENLYAIGGAENEAWAVGAKGTVLHMQQNRWQRIQSPTPESLHGIWMEKSGSVFCAGTNGTLLHFDGGSWKKNDVPGRENLYALWGNGAIEVWAVGEKGTVLQFDGTAWKKVRFPKEVNLKAVHGLRHAGPYVAGEKGSIFCFDRGNWKEMALPEGTLFNVKGMTFSRDEKILYTAGSNLALTGVQLK